MTKRTWMILTAMVAVGFVACSPGPDDKARNEAVPDLEQAREEFQERTGAQMQALQDEMKGLKDQVGDIDEVPDVKVRIEQWERKYQEVEQKLKAKESATLEEWRRFEGEINAELTELRAAYSDLASDVRASLG